MFVGRVVGNVWATRKNPSLEGLRMLLVQQMDGVSGKAIGKVTMAISQTIDAGPGDTVLVMDEGSSTRTLLEDDVAPIRTTIIGIVDTVSEGRTGHDYQ